MKQYQPYREGEKQECRYHDSAIVNAGIHQNTISLAVIRKSVQYTVEPFQAKLRLNFDVPLILDSTGRVPSWLSSSPWR